MFQTQMGEVAVIVVATTLKPRSPAKSIFHKECEIFRAQREATLR